MGADSRRRVSRRAIVAFYKDALDEAERADFEAALGIEGLDGEVALLRLLLKESAAANPRSVDFMLKGIGALVRALTARYKLTPEEQESIEEAVRRLAAEFDREVAGAPP